MHLWALGVIVSYVRQHVGDGYEDAEYCPPVWYSQSSSSSLSAVKEQAPPLFVAVVRLVQLHAQERHRFVMKGSLPPLGPE